MVLIERHLTAEALNNIVNDPHVRPFVAPGNQPLDLTSQLANTNNVALVGEFGACVFLKLLPGVYEVHTQVRKEGRGAWTNEMTKACTAWMFINTDAYEILTRVPKGHVGAKVATINAGGRFDFTREKECLFRGNLIDVHVYSFRIQDWLNTQPEGLVEAGRKFHDLLHAEADRLGVTDPAHADDDNHNLYVGAAVAMVRAGRPIKGLLTYNRWALISRHVPIIPISMEKPVVAKIDHGLYVTFEDDGIRVSLP